jgi:hypothetical protein
VHFQQPGWCVTVSCQEVDANGQVDFRAVRGVGCSNSNLVNMLSRNFGLESTLVYLSASRKVDVQPRLWLQFSVPSLAKPRSLTDSLGSVVPPSCIFVTKRWRCGVE